MTEAEALAAIDDCFNGAFGSAGAEVVVEEFLTGEEASFFCLCDGTTALPFGTAQDHKRVGDGDTGPNTGGMGAYSPAPVMTPDIVERTMKEIVEPTMRGMAELGAPFSGVLFAGLMITPTGPKLIEYNTRFGDPECQVLMMRLKDDLLVLARSCGRRPACAYVGALARRCGADRGHGGQGLSRRAGKGLGDSRPRQGRLGRRRDFPRRHGRAGRKHRRQWRTRAQRHGSRPRTVTEAQRLAYEAVDRIDWPEGFCRRDIGWRAVERENAR